MFAPPPAAKTAANGAKKVEATPRSASSSRATTPLFQPQKDPVTASPKPAQRDPVPASPSTGGRTQVRLAREWHSSH
jgi:hypothetical protein